MHTIVDYIGYILEPLSKIRYIMFVTHHRRHDEQLLNRDSVGARNASTVSPEYPRECTGRVGVSKGPGVRRNASSSALPPGPWSNL